MPRSERCTTDSLDTLIPAGDNPASGEGFESALAYVVADHLVRVPPTSAIWAASSP